MALLNGQRHVPHRDSKIGQLLRDSLGNVTCRTCMLAHVSADLPHYNETLQVIQLAARIHRMKRRRTKFSSTSSEDSSTDESAKFRRPYRGLRMGTLREDVLYSSSLSDPDYTSSSEQSCDTVIYMGANGQSLSDRELTDNEGPPRHVPRTNPRLPRRPSGSRSSGDDSDSGRSRASEGRYTPRPSMGVRAGASGGSSSGSPATSARGGPQHVMSAPGSPSHVKMAHRINTGYGKGATGGGGKGAESSSSSSSHWPDKVKGHRVKASSVDKAGEQWVDGPGAAIYPESKKAGEQWVDGPSAFRVQNDPLPPPPTQQQQQQQQQQHQQPQQQQQQQHQTPAVAAAAATSSSTPQSPSHRGDTARRLKNRKVEAEELWVDGPREMMASSAGGGGGGGTGTGTGTGGSGTPLHTSLKLEPAQGRAAVPGQPNQGPKLSMAVNEKALKQALIKHLEKECVDSSTSTEGPLTSVSMLDVSAGVSGSPRLGGGGGGEWGRRQAGDGVSVVDLDEHNHHHNNNHHDSSSSTPTPSSPYRKHHHHHHHHHKLLASSSSPRHSPKASPACSRKTGGVATAENASGGGAKTGVTTARLQKSDLPGSASPTHRVAQWIKSVTKSDAAVASGGGASTTTGLQQATTSEMPPVTTTTTTPDVTMADAETNTEHDSDFERMADSGGSTPPLVAAAHSSAGVSLAEGGVGSVDTCNSHHNSNVTFQAQQEQLQLQQQLADSSFDSSMDTTSRGSGGGGAGGTCRDSLYELTVEEQLENLASRQDSSMLAKDVDDETFSSLSCREAEAEETEREDSLLVQHSKVLTEGRQSAKLARHLAQHAGLSPLSSSSAAAAAVARAAHTDPTASLSFLHDLQSKPLLSRKPDGASNPHLNREFSEEDCVSLGDQCVVMGSTGHHYAVPDTEVYAATTTTTTTAAAAATALYGSKDALDASSSPSLSTKGNSSTSKLAIRSKPPLPQKPLSSSSSSSMSSSPKVSNSNNNNNSSSSTHNSGLVLKSSLVSSSSCSTSSGPSAGSSATSTPKSLSSKDSGNNVSVNAKQTSPRGSALPVLTNGHSSAAAAAVRKDKAEKNSNKSPVAKERGGGGGGSSGGGGSGTSSPNLSNNTSPSGGNGKGGVGGGVANSSASKLPLLSSKSAALASSASSLKDGKLRKKDKDNAKVNRSINGKLVELSPQQHHGGRGPRSGGGGNTADSDSGNDSGIVAHEKRLLSPYATVTKPRTPSHSSSGHGSDNSSTLSTEVHSAPSSKGDKLHGGTSSGYESMLRESEGTASDSDQEDSGSDKEGDRKKTGSKRKGTKRSRSAPARSSESPSSNGGGSQGSRAWQESRHGKAKEEPLELKNYDVQDLERLQRRDPECRNGSDRSRERSKEVESRQPLLEEGSKPDLIDNKDRISLEQRGWGFDCKFLMCFCKSRNSRSGTDV